MVDMFLEPFQKLSPEVHTGRRTSIAFIDCINYDPHFMHLSSHAVKCLNQTTGGWLAGPISVIGPLLLKNTSRPLVSLSTPCVELEDQGSECLVKALLRSFPKVEVKIQTIAIEMLDNRR